MSAVLVTLPASDQRLDEIRYELKNGGYTLKTVMQYVQNGWPEEKRRIHGPISKYWSERVNISLHSGLLLRGRRIIIPPRLRADVLRRLHDGHQGIAKTRANLASQSGAWNLPRNHKVVQNCAMCEKYRRERIEPMKSTEFPDRPSSKVGVDFFQHKDKHYLLAVDYFSRDVEICLVSKNVNSSQTILQLKKIFSERE